MEDKIISVNIGQPSELSAQIIHDDILLQLPAVTYLHVYRLMTEIINHSCCKESNNE
jgi:hypothetical protein